MEDHNIQQTLTVCTTVGDALLMLQNCGYQSGGLQITGEKLTGLVLFDRGVISHSFILETNQRGEEAYARLSILSGARFRFIPQQFLAGADTAREQIAGEDSLDYALRMQVADMLFPQDAPLPSVATFKMIGRSAVAPAAPAGAGATEVARRRIKSSPAAALLGSLLTGVTLMIGICIFAVPYAVWSTDDSGNSQEKILHRNDGKVLTLPFANEAGAVAALSASAGLPESVNAASQDTENEATARRTSNRSGSAEFSLADSRSSLGQLEQLIYSYMAKGKYRRARDLALAAVMSVVTTPEEKARFWELCKQCESKY